MRELAAQLTKPVSRSATLRVLPFAVFIVLLVLRAVWPQEGPLAAVDTRWLYALQAGGAALLLAYGWRSYCELSAPPSWRQAVLGLVVGVAVWWLWTTLDAPWMRTTSEAAPFRPVDEDGRLIWGLLAVRALGAVLVVPLIEELFWRGWLMRWLEHHDFLAVEPQRIGLRAIVLSNVLFALAHHEWFVAALAGLAYSWLYRRTGSLWCAVLAHAVTNGLLAVWVVLGGHWAYW